MKKKLLFGLLACLCIWACSIEEVIKEGPEIIEGTQGLNSLIRQSSQDECTLIESGLDVNRDNILNDSEVTGSELLCPVNGENGLASLFDIQRQDTCIVVSSGLDNNRNGVLDPEEVNKSEEVCAVRGDDGNPGEDGNDGKNTLIRIDVSESCELGGATISVGLDVNGDNILQDEEIQQSTDICNQKCVKDPKCKYVVYDTKKCNDGILYSFWMDGTRYSNVSLHFRLYADNTARLWGKVAKHGNDDLHTLDISFAEGTDDEYKYPNCLDEDVNVNEWIQYTEMSGELIEDYTGKVYELTRRGPATQFGIGSNPTNQYLSLGFSGWLWANAHNNCKADININLEKECW